MQDNESEQQSQWNGERRDDGGAGAGQEEDQHDQNQDHSAEQIVFHRVHGQLNQIAAIVVGTNLDVGRQLPVELLGFGLDPFQYVLCLLTAAHQDDAFDGVWVVPFAVLESELAQAGRVADHHVTDVSYTHGRAVLARQYDVLDVFAVAQQADSTHVIELAPLRVKPAACVAVVGRERLDHARHREVIPV